MSIGTWDLFSNPDDTLSLFSLFVLESLDRSLESLGDKPSFRIVCFMMRRLDGTLRAQPFHSGKLELTLRIRAGSACACFTVWLAAWSRGAREGDLYPYLHDNSVQADTDGG